MQETASLSRIRSGKNPREFFDEAEMNELAESIRSYGVLQPILVRPAGDAGQIADTGFFQSGGPDFAHAARLAIPLGRQGLPRECADLVVFLASDEASFISGAEIAIDGGYIAAGLANLRNRARAEYGRNSE